MSCVLPVELWRVIISFLPNADQCICLSVCAVFHDIALPHVFRRVTLFLGLWHEARDPLQLDPRALDRVYLPPLSAEDSHRRQQTSLDMLARISEDPHFAKQVKVVNIGAFGCKHNNCCRGISDLLTQSLRCLTSLESLAYFGDRPAFDVSMLHALACGSATTLRHLRIPAGWNVDSGHLRATFKLESLVVGRLRDADLEPYPPPPESDLAKSAVTIRTLANAGTETLKRIRVPDFTWFTPASLRNLSELELTYLHGRDLDVSVVLTHFTCLRSLVLVSVEHRHVAPFATNPTALPLLHSFDVSARYYVPVANFGQFILAKKHLRRLNVMTCDETLELLDLLPRLPRLEVLGLDLWCAVWTAELHERLDNALPRSLTALLIWDGIQQSDVPKADWARLLQKRTALRYFHVLAENGRDADISAELLEHRPPSLELLGLGSKLRWVLTPFKCESPDGDNAYSTPWSLAKVWFRGAEDFGDPDWEWLLRGHNASLFETAHVIA